jgi:DNA-binding MarR family transcriptional regulator/GNAT superfamily N-acetyltransferase
MSGRQDGIAAVRRFNRFYTRQLGILRKNFLDSRYTLGEARVLYEIASGSAPTASAIGRALDLDAGYLSRTLRNFEKHGLIARKTTANDARQSRLVLTARGRRAFAPLETRSQRQAGDMLKSLSAAEQARLIAAMTTIESLLEPQTVAAVKPDRGFVLSAPKEGDFGWIVQRHAQLYYNEYNWNGPFEDLCARIVADFLSADADRDRQRCWIAEVDGENVGSVLLAKDSETVARIRLLLVEPKARGLGIGKALIDACVHFAREAGYTKVTLWTHSVLTAARHIYEKAGFKLVRSEEHDSWGQPVIGEHWDLDLSAGNSAAAP